MEQLTKSFVIGAVDFRPGESVAKISSTDNQVITIVLEGGCCSRSFFDRESRLDLQDLLGHRLLRIESVVIPSGIEPATYADADDSTINYCLLFTTNKASISVLWRNESNGYYDGWANIYLDGQLLSRLGSGHVVWSSQTNVE